MKDIISRLYYFGTLKVFSILHECICWIDVLNICSLRHGSFRASWLCAVVEKALNDVYIYYYYISPNLPVNRNS